jgi:hypothetical protein
MAGCQRRELFRALVVEGTAEDQDRTDMLLGKSCEGRFEIAIGSGINNNELQAQRARRPLQVCDHGLDTRKGRVGKNSEPGSIGYALADYLQSFWPQLHAQSGVASNVPAWTAEAVDKTQSDRVRADAEDDWNGPGRCLGRQRCGGAAEGYDHGHAAANEIGCKCGQPV